MYFKLRLKMKLCRVKLFFYKYLKLPKKYKEKFAKNIQQSMLKITKESYEKEIFNLEELKIIYNIK